MLAYDGDDGCMIAACSLCLVFSFVAFYGALYPICRLSMAFLLFSLLLEDV